MRTRTAVPVSSTLTAMASPKLCASPDWDDDTWMRASMRASGSLWVRIRRAPWLCSISSRWSGLMATVLLNVRSYSGRSPVSARAKVRAPLASEASATQETSRAAPKRRRRERIMI